MRNIDIFRGVMVFLHSTAAICSLILCFACNGARLSQNWTVPYVSTQDVSCTSSRMECFRSNQKYNDSIILNSYFFNPYLLIMVFQWITASFSLFHIRHLWSGIRYTCIAWYKV